jgi:hypothetical protein
MSPRLETPSDAFGSGKMTCASSPRQWTDCERAVPANAAYLPGDGDKVSCTGYEKGSNDLIRVSGACLVRNPTRQHQTETCIKQEK